MTTSILYTITGCNKCKSVIEYLQKHGVSYEEVNILESPKRARELEQIAGEVVVPVLSHQGELYHFQGDWEEHLEIRSCSSGI